MKRELTTARKVKEYLLLRRRSGSKCDPKAKCFSSLPSISIVQDIAAR